MYQLYEQLNPCNLLVFYLLVLTFVALIIIGGYDATMRLIAFIDLNTRYAFLKALNCGCSRNKIERELEKDRKEFKSQQEKNRMSDQRIF